MRDDYRTGENGDGQYDRDNARSNGSLPPAAGGSEDSDESGLPPVAGERTNSSPTSQRQNAENWEELSGEFDNLVDQIDSSDLETLGALPEGTGPETRHRLMRKMAERGTGAHDIEIEDPAPDFDVPDDPRQNGHDPQADGNIRQNATDSELPPAAGEEIQSEPNDLSRVNSTQNRLAEMSDAAAAVFGILESEGAQSASEIAPETGLSRRDTQKALDELKGAGFAHRANSKGWKTEYEPTPVADR